jgi:hypothetical protein
MSRSTFYARLKELEFQPRRIKQKTYLLVKEAVELLHYADYLSRGGNLQGWKEKQFALSTQVEPSEITPPHSKELETIDIETLRYLSEAAKEGWWLPTGTIANWLGWDSAPAQSHVKVINSLPLAFSLNEPSISGEEQFSGQFDLFEINERVEINVK